MDPVAPAPENSRTKPWRILAWVVIAFLITSPWVLMGGFVFDGSAYERLGWSWYANRPGICITAAVFPAAFATWGFIRGVHRRTVALRRWSVAGVSLGLLAGLSFLGLYRSSQSWTDRAALSPLRQLAAAADQLFLEHPERIFVEFDEIVGPRRYVKAIAYAELADYRALFPLRRDETDCSTWVLSLPDGRKISYLEAPPKADGLDVVRLPDGSRFETTYAGGVADGPFRAFYPDGRPWGEANYIRGRVTGPRWLHPPQGSKFDEAGILRSETAARLGVEKYLARDFAGAVTTLTRALEANAASAFLYRVRGDAHRALGDLPAALADYDRSLQLKPDNSVYYRRGHLRRWQQDLAAAAADFERALGNETASEIFAPAAFWLYIVGCEQGRKAEATARLAALTQKFGLQRARWDEQVGGFLLGRVDGRQLHSFGPTAGSSTRAGAWELEETFFTAMKAQLAGDQAKAIAGFRAALAAPRAARLDPDDFDDAHEILREEARRIVEPAARR